MQRDITLATKHCGTAETAERMTWTSTTMSTLSCVLLPCVSKIIASVRLCRWNRICKILAMSQGHISSRLTMADHRVIWILCQASSYVINIFINSNQNTMIRTKKQCVSCNTTYGNQNFPTSKFFKIFLEKLFDRIQKKVEICPKV